MDKKLLSASIPKFYTLQKNFQSLLLITILCLCSFAQAQGPGSLFVDAGPDQTIDCSGTGCVDLTATFLETFDTSGETYTVTSIPYTPPFAFDGLANPLNPNIDDAWSSVDSLPFDFCFFGDTETEFQVGSNGVIRFDVDPGDTSNGWSFDEDLPNNSNPTLGEANIFTPVHDIDPAASSNEEIGYEVLGTFPNRVLVVSYFEVPMFSTTCNSLLATHQVVFYEFSNVIEMYIQDKPSCPSWNDGNAALGIQNDAGDTAFVAPGRNTSDSPWTATNEAWSFSPTGMETYIFEWLDSSGTVIGTDPTINVCPTEASEIYTARITYTNTCNGEVVILTDDVEVTQDGTSNLTLDLGEDLSFCDQTSYEIVPTITGDPTGATYLWSPNGETTPTITVTTSDTYGLEISLDGCTISDSVTLTFLTSPNCTILSECDTLDFNEDFGAGTGRICIDPATATTTYTCNTTTMVNDGEYSVTNISDGLNTGWHPGMEDHTPGDVNGRALYVNADFTLGEFYRRTITLDTATDYSFGAWITTVYDTDTGICGGTGIPSNVIFRIEDPVGTLIAETNTGDIPNGPNPNWQQFFIDFNTGANTDIQLVLINNSIGGCGNDLAIDDITLEFSSAEPEIVTPPDLEACDTGNDGTEVFDLTTQIPTILDGANPAELNVSFHITQFDAEAGQLAIADPTNYNSVTNPETIYVRVERVTQEACFATVNFDLILNPVIDLTTDLPTEVGVCDTDALPVLDATATNSGIDLTMVTYEWTDGTGTVVSTNPVFSPTISGTYTVVLTLAPCSENTYTVEVDITESATLDLGADQILCDGAIYEIVPIITGNTAGIVYTWSTGETTPTIIVNETGDYSLTITVGNCTATDNVLVTISDPLEISIGEDFETCFSENTELTVTTTDFDLEDATFQWFLNGSEIVGETMATLPIIEVGTYSVLVTVNDCTATDEVVVSLKEAITVTLEDDFNTCPNETQTITASTSATDPVFSWFLNGDALIDETNATLEIALEPGTMGTQIYSVIVSEGDCTGEAEVGITLYDIGNCTISQGISPNNDGFNDTLDLEFLNDRTGIVQLQIFNRLGSLVYEKTNYVNEWQGQTTDNEELPTGTYYYVLDLQGEDPVFGAQAAGWIYLNREAN